MVVAEHTRSHAYVDDASSGLEHSLASSSVTLCLSPVALSIFMMCGQLWLSHAAQADIMADPRAPANQRPVILETANGLPLVNIQTPSAAGVSRNTYHQFDVKSEGAILNNSNANVQTKLGGWVQGNPNLAGGTARVILNEVNSHNPSLLNGYIEVAGRRAQVVIANPAGISCSSCGFINANRATLTTGTPMMSGGNLLGYRVSTGSIQFNGDGLDSTQSSFTDVIARAVNINAGIWANHLSVTTGANQVNIDSNGHQTSVTSISPGTGTIAPVFAVDVAALGGMYAGKIHMLGTEVGLGVRNAGSIGASVGEVHITADGLLQNTGNLSAKNNIELNTVALESPGSIQTDGNIGIHLDTDYTHTGQLQAGDNLSLQSTGDLTNQSTILASQALTLSAHNIVNTATGEIAGKSTALDVAETLTNRGLIDGVDTFISAGMLSNTDTGNLFGDHLAIQVAHLENTAGAVIAAREQLDIGATTIQNRDNSLLFSAGDLALGGALDSKREATSSADSLINEHGTIEALGDLRIRADDIQNLNAKLVTALVQTDSGSFDRFTPRGTSVILNTADYPGARIGDVGISWRWADQYYFREYHRYYGTTATLETQVIDSAPGQIISGGNMTLTGNITNSDSQIISGSNLDVTGASLQNLNSQGETIFRSRGHAYYYDYDGSGSGFRYDVDYLGGYNPADVVTTYNLSTTKFAQHTTPTGSGTSVASVSTPVIIGSLFQPNPDVSAQYLIETNPRFTKYRTWLSSDYMLSQLAFDPATMQKRLGDGFYEQRLIRDQIAQLTGRRFLDGFASDEAQYQALMEAGITFANAWQLVPGIALTAEQITQLTSDIVWLVEESVRLKDGTVTQALVPKIYVRLQPQDLHPSTGLMTGNTVTMEIAENITNAGTIAGRNLVALNSDNVRNLGGQINANAVSVHASQDIDIQGGTLAASDALVLQAGDNINVASTTQSNANQSSSGSFTRTNLDRMAELYVTGDNGILVASADHNINLQGGAISNTGANGFTVLDAGHNLNLTTIHTDEQNHTIKNSKNYIQHGYTQEIGSVIQTEGDLVLNAGNDLTARAANVTSEQGHLTVNAGNDINIEAGEATSNMAAARTTKRSGTFSSKKTTRRDTYNDTDVISSTFSGDSIHLNASHDLSIRGSHVVATNNVHLDAGHNITLDAAQATHDETHYYKTKRTGFSASSNSIGYGSSTLASTNDTQQVMNVGSTAGSVMGDVVIEAGKTYTQNGSDALAPQGDIDITAQQVNIVAAENLSKTVQETRFKQSGLTISVQSSALNLAQNLAGTAQATLQSESNSNKVLNALQTYANSKTLKEQSGATIDAIKADNIQGAAASAGVKLSVSIGSAKSESSSSSSLTTHQGSLVKAGGDVGIKATQDDLSVAGSRITADKNVILDAARNINLMASADTESNRSKNKSSSASIGLSVGIGGQGAGFSVGIDASRGKGSANSDNVTYNNAQISAGEILALNSGNDTNLVGANASGKEVIANIGGDLNIKSLQDTASSNAKQSNTGISVSIPIGVGTPGGSISQSKQKSNGNYASVYEQSGIKAGEEGFDINVTGNTDLRGALIDSIADSDKNKLTTGTLTASDIQNHMKAIASSSGTTISSDMLTSKYAAAKGIASNLQNRGEEDISDSSTTYSAISPASITITDETAQIELTGKNAEETIAALNRDTTDTNRVLAKPNMEALQEKAQQEQADRLLLSATFSTFTDESFKKMFLTKSKVFEVARNDEGKVILDADGKPIMYELNEAEKFNLNANGDSKKLNVFTNGIFNDEDAAGKYSIQMAEAPAGEKVYLVYFPDANNFFSELLIAGYQKYLEGTALGITNATQQVITLSQTYGQDGLNLIGHSRGAMTIGNALEILNTMGLEDPLSNTSIKFVGPAYSAQEAANSLDTLSGGTQTTVQLQNHIADFVGRLIGGNQATYGEVSEGSSLIKEWINMFGEAPTVHSCYGNNGSDSPCTQTYGKPISVNIPSSNATGQ